MKNEDATPFFYDGEGSFNSHHNIYISIDVVGETRASGKMVSGAMVQGAGRADRSGIAGHNLLRKICPNFQLFN